MIESIHRQEASSNWNKLKKKYFYEDYLDIDPNDKENQSLNWVNIYL